ncbi:MAG TPA: hypothetical protein VL993_04245 [Stellaceae bacterium]|nr:hypothetical protein [Stellaceae bacterium]
MGEAKRRRTDRTALRRLYAPSRPAPISKLIIPSGMGTPSRETAFEAARIAEGIRARVRAALVRASAGGSLESVFDAIDSEVEACVADYEAAVAQAASFDVSRRAEMEGVACRRGCAFCCFVNVDVTPLEAIRLARRASPAAPGAVRPGRTPCALLADSACSHYAIRPIVCRSVYSRDAGACEAAFESTEAAASMPSLDWPRFLASGFLTGQVAALTDLRLEGHMVSLNEALRVMTADRGAVVRWLNGADVFPRRAGQPQMS